MRTRRWRIVVGVGAGLFLPVLGGMVGMALDRMRFEPEHAALLARAEGVVRANQGAPLTIGPDAPADTLR